MKKPRNYKNAQFIESAILNDLTFNDYLNRLRRVALSRFKWKLPNSMNSIYLEKSLFNNGMSALLFDKNYGFINTDCASSGDLNIYHLPTKLNCFSFNYQTTRKLYTGLNPSLSEIQRKQWEQYECILVQNNWDLEPTAGTLELFAYRLYQAERAIDTNVNAQRTPIVILVDEKQRLTVENIYSQYEGNRPVIIADKTIFQGNPNLGIKAINTEAKFVALDLSEYKTKIWNEALTFLGINNILEDKKERLITDEANANNELINLNLFSYLEPRQLACEQFNEKFGLKGTEKEISVEINSDLHNIVKEAQSSVSYLKGGENNGNLYNATSQSM